MTTTETKTYHVGVIERAIAYYEVEAENPRDAAENWEDGLFFDRDDEALESEGPCSVREKQPDGSWRKLPPSEWDSAPLADHRADEPNYVIHSVGEAAYWSNQSGWGSADAADVFSSAERDRLALPMGGEWFALHPYSVLLLYPPDMNDTGYETYYAFVTAPDALEAVAAAQRQASAAQEGAEIEADDFHPLLVTQGHHSSEPLFNQ